MSEVTRKEVLMVLADATQDGADAKRLALIRRDLPPRQWNAAPTKRVCPHCRVSGSAQAPCSTCKGTEKIKGVGIELNADAMSSYGERSVVMVNPDQKSFWTRHGRAKALVLSFGAYGWTNLHVFADDLDEALEEAAAWLAGHAPGHIMLEGSEELMELRREACAEAGLAWPMPHFSMASESDLAKPYWDAFQEAESDLMYTESGYLTSSEVFVSLESPTTEELYQFIKGGHA